MELSQHIIDLVGALYDEGLDDETICNTVVEFWHCQGSHMSFATEVRSSELMPAFFTCFRS